MCAFYPWEFASINRTAKYTSQITMGFIIWNKQSLFCKLVSGSWIKFQCWFNLFKLSSSKVNHEQKSSFFWGGIFWDTMYKLFMLELLNETDNFFKVIEEKIRIGQKNLYHKCERQISYKIFWYILHVNSLTVRIEIFVWIL